MKIHSNTPLISNSSTTIVSIATYQSVRDATSLIQMIMDVLGVSGEVSDYFDISLKPTEYFGDLMYDMYLDEEAPEDAPADWTPEDSVWQEWLDAKAKEYTDAGEFTASDGSPYFDLVIEERVQPQKLTVQNSGFSIGYYLYTIFEHEAISS